MIRWYTDPHLGINRAANTTQSSSKALREALYQAALDAAGSGNELTICLGDMFDTFSNPEPIHAQGMALIARTHMTLSGNHDVVNQADRIGTLELLNSHWLALDKHSRALFSQFGKPSAHSWKIDAEKAVIVFVPHVATQELFEESLNQAANQASYSPEDYKKILCLHCNYDFSDERLNETTLNLTSEWARVMLGAFDYVLLGHEHIPAEHFGGRLIILGNTHPTSLSDVSDKRIAIFEDGEFRFESIWCKETGYAEFQAGELPESTSVNFARLQGQVDTGDMLEVMKAVSAMWRKSPDLYVLKMEMEVKSAITESVDVITGLAQLPDLIRNELKETPELLELWDELRSE